MRVRRACVSMTMLVALEGAAMHVRGQDQGAAAAATPGVGAAAAQGTVPGVSAIAGGVIRGKVSAGTTPLPGVAVTAANSLTGKRYTTTTDVTGAFAMRIPANGRYVVRTELAAFAGQTREVVVNAAGENGGKPEQVVEIGMELASRVAAEQQATQAASISRAIGGSGLLQSLSLQASGAAGAADATAGGGNQGAQLPSLAGLRKMPRPHRPSHLLPRQPRHRPRRKWRRRSDRRMANRPPPPPPPPPPDTAARFDGLPASFRAVALPATSIGGTEAANYKAIVFGLLAAAKRYPDGARARGATGAAVVAFGVDSSGRLLSATLARPSGDAALDAEALEYRAPLQSLSAATARGANVLRRGHRIWK